ncbi:porin family protein [Salmonella enterica]|nr:porin family protein [Salmonella enterica]HCL1641422.1 porin family protein [Salmonella enterica subsp. enterica serovar 4,[5],12:i:-]ECR8416791.1 porin family protein [Salmonella enterica]EEU9073086.1 porin family protein [Salmonella enterica]EHQ1051610.1 porin family protein [Salmonella enterica]
MKKLTTVCALSILGMFSFSANAAGEKTGLYLNGKAGVSVLQLSGQSQNFSYADDHEKYNGGSSRDTVFTGGIALGYDFSSNFDIPVRAEIEFSSRGKSHTGYNLEKESSDNFSSRWDAKTQLSLNTVMVNAYYDFKNQSAFTPFISAGLGYARVHQKTTLTDIYSEQDFNDVTSSSRSGTSNNFAWSLGAGVKYALTSNVNVDLSYRYLDAGKTEVSSATEDEEYKSKASVKTNDITLGVTYSF